MRLVDPASIPLHEPEEIWEIADGLTNGASNPVAIVAELTAVMRTVHRSGLGDVSTHPCVVAIFSQLRTVLDRAGGRFGIDEIDAFRQLREHREAKREAAVRTS